MVSLLSIIDKLRKSNIENWFLNYLNTYTIIQLTNNNF